MKAKKTKRAAAHLVCGDVVHAWRGTRYEDYMVDRVELTSDRLGGRRGAYPECVARVFIQGQEKPFYTGPANKQFEIV